MPGKVLVACERSGMVRNAFRELGHNAWSCDVLPAEDNSPYHIQDDVLNVFFNWDLIIAHPPCTYLTVAAEWAYKDGPYHQKVNQNTLVGLARRQAREEAIAFVEKLWNAPSPRIAIENPIGVLSTRMFLPTQIIHPWMFGDDASKATCLWLRGLPPLETCETQFYPPRIVKKGEKTYLRWGNQTDSGQNRLTPSPDRSKLRSTTYPGIARAMAEQWGKLL